LNFETLIQNLQLNDGAGQLLIPMNYAVGESNHTTTLRIAQPWAGGHHRVVSDADGRIDLDLDFTSEQKVRVIALDEFVDAEQLPLPDYLKVDVDGSELAFIRGAKSILSRVGLKALMFELHFRDKNCQHIIDLLSSDGFEVHGRYEIEPHLFNVWFQRRAET
jgi:FkbM family methyltransferase